MAYYNIIAVLRPVRTDWYLRKLSSAHKTSSLGAESIQQSGSPLEPPVTVSVQSTAVVTDTDFCGGFGSRLPTNPDNPSRSRATSFEDSSDSEDASLLSRHEKPDMRSWSTSSHQNHHRLTASRPLSLSSRTLFNQERHAYYRAMVWVMGPGGAVNGVVNCGWLCLLVIAIQDRQSAHNVRLY